MMILVHSSPRSVQKFRNPSLGILCSPRCVYADDIQQWPWAADNDAYSSWDGTRYLAMLERITGRTGCLFVTAPDVVGDAKTTTHLFHLWLPLIQKTGQPVALVAQDGIQHAAIPWDQIDALFVGGTTPFKLGHEARRAVREAKTRNKWVHMGRVNSHQRVRYAKAIGCDSIDGTQFSWFKDAKLPQFLQHATAPTQLMMEALQ